ncbi:hypothetical protein EBR57_00920 [bacterium]|nr:hypothetical protein [bacterium]
MLSGIVRFPTPQIVKQLPIAQTVRTYTQNAIQTSHSNRSTTSLLREGAVLQILGNPSVSRIVGKIINGLPDAVIDTPPVATAFRPIASQFGTVDSNLDRVLSRFTPSDVADLAKEGIGLHEDPKPIFERHLLTVTHPNVRHMALKLSSFVPAPLLQSGIVTPAFKKGEAMMREICRLGEDLDKKIYIDAEGVAEQRLIHSTQLKLGAEFNDTVYLTFQSMRSDSLQQLETYLEWSLKTGLTPRIKQVKGAYHTQESQLFPQFYNQSFTDTHEMFKQSIALVGQFPGKKHQFIGTMNPSLIQFATRSLSPNEHTIANLKGMEVGPSLGVPTLIYHPIALKPSELAKYGVRRLIELGNPSALTQGRLSIVKAVLRQRMGMPPLPDIVIQPEAPLTVPSSKLQTAAPVMSEEAVAARSTLDTMIASLHERADAKSALSTPEVRDQLIKAGQSTFHDSLRGVKVNPVSEQVLTLVEALTTNNPKGAVIFDTPEMNALIVRLRQDHESAMNHPGF